MWNIWRLYVRDGNTALIDLPKWVADVANAVALFEGLRESRRIQDEDETRRSQSIVDAAAAGGHGLVV